MMILARIEKSLTVSYLQIMATFAVAMMVTVMPLPGLMAAYRPDLVLLVLIYWCLQRPDIVGIVLAFLIGILLDSLLFATLGQNTLAKIIVAYFVLRIAAGMGSIPYIYQSLLVLFLLLVNSLVIVAVDFFTNQSTSHFLPLWFSPFVGAIFWYMFVSLTRVRFENDHAISH